MHDRGAARRHRADRRNRTPVVAGAATVAVAALAAAACADPAVVTARTVPTTVADAEAPVTTEPPATTAVPATTAPASNPPPTTIPAPDLVRTGAERLVESDFAALAGLRLGLIVNQTSVAGDRHLIDAAAASPTVELVTVFAPEHGVRGTADAGELLGDEVDPITGVPIVSLYGPGAARVPTADHLAEIDALVYDLQDVGTRFYTYISTMGLAMQAAADAGVAFVVLDRPNPQGGVVVEGPVRTPDQESFVGLYPIPSTYGLTAGELATMIVGEGWLPGLAELDLRIVELEGWRRAPWPLIEEPWIPPSPGLPTPETAATYPGTVLLEATTVSYGSGTEAPFATAAAPWLDGAALAARLDAAGLPGVRFEAVTITPDPGIAPRARFPDQAIEGVRIRVTDPETVRPVAVGIHLLCALRDLAAEGDHGPLIDRPAAFDRLAGSATVRLAVEAGAGPDEIIGSWADDVDGFVALRTPYLRYDD